MDLFKTVNFEYNHQSNGQSIPITYPIEIPYKGDIIELAHYIVDKKMDRVWKYLDAHINLERALKLFVQKENQKYYNECDEDLLTRARNGQWDLDALIRNTDRSYKEEILEFAERIGPSDEDIFAQSFHRLVHSPLLSTVLEKEKSYAKTISEMAVKMDMDLEKLTLNQQNEMEEKIQQLDVTTTSEDINNLLSQQYSNQGIVQKKWESELEAMKGHQKNEYRNWITLQVSKTLVSEPRPTPVGARSSMFVLQTPSMEESFTIHLGSQLKHMHNIRILSADINDLCSPLHTDDNLTALNMSLGLYSSSLCGIVVLTPSGFVQANRSIFKNAYQSTEFHFDQINDQIDRIQNKLKQIKSNQGKGRNVDKLKSGDFFITRHSNLSQSHVIFHLISDEPLNSPDEITSRHPVLLGLRNILKIACKHDVTMLTIPALLRHEMSEDMTVPWCIRRAELIFKCAKGFMIESATWGGTELSTLQLLLPRNVSEELFSTLVGMVPHVFRVANPKFLDNS